MKIRLPHFANTLLFRISATFLLLLGISLGGYYLWIEKTVFNPFENAEEENWYQNLSSDELDSLSTELAGAGDAELAADLLVAYGKTVHRYDVEVIAFGADGQYRYSTDPDSLGTAVPQVRPQLLQAMSLEDWDYGSYPDSTDATAYINRIFEVYPIQPAAAESPDGYLVASYFPLSITSTDLNADSRMLEAQEKIFKVLIGLLLYSAITALLIMAWTSRRIQRLSAGVDAFAAGDLSLRVRTRSTDEIGNLGRNFNSMAERIECMVEKLRQKEQFQRQLIANVSHDLRTPMASMKGYAETLLMDGDLDRQERDRYLRIITGNLEHLDQLVERMLVLSRFDSGQATFQLEDFPIAELADSILLRFEGLAAEKGVQLAVSVAPEVELVHADPLQIAQVLQNLVENGIKFNRPGGSVTIGVRRLADRVEVAVRDTGQGIQAADLPRIFDRFFTGDESRTRRSEANHMGQSSGLGLAIASKIVAGHHSMLRVESLPGEGTVFRFQLEAGLTDDQEFVGDA